MIDIEKDETEKKKRVEVEIKRYQRGLLLDFHLLADRQSFFSLSDSTCVNLVFLSLHLILTLLKVPPISFSFLRNYCFFLAFFLANSKKKKGQMESGRLDPEPRP